MHLQLLIQEFFINAYWEIRVIIWGKRFNNLNNFDLVQNFKELFNFRNFMAFTIGTLPQSKEQLNIGYHNFPLIIHNLQTLCWLIDENQHTVPLSSHSTNVFRAQGRSDQLTSSSYFLNETLYPLHILVRGEITK